MAFAIVAVLPALAVVPGLTAVPGLAAVAVPPACAEEPASGPALFVPPRPDSARDAETPPAPLLIPGRRYAPDTLHRTSAQVALDFFRRGVKLEGDGNPQAAMAAYRSAVGLDPTLPGAYQRMGQIFEAFGAISEALQAYAAEVEHHPDNRGAARQLGLSLARVGESDRAIQQLELLVRRNTRDGASWRALGFAYTHARRFKDAERALRTAISLPPADAEEHRDLGVLLANQGREREAREAYLRAAKLDPKDGAALINLGNLEMRAGRPAAALGHYREAEARDTSGVFAYRGQVQALAALGREAEIADTYRRWLRRAPDDEGARLEAVQHFTDKGRTDVALEIGRDGVRRASRSGFARMTLGVAYGAAGDARNSLLEFRRAEHYLPKTDAAALARVNGLIAELRAGAPDSLRALFVSDSLASGAKARGDSLKVPGFAGPRPGQR
ncbi:MAG: tetratricopeptide repeat protein [Candidatus Eisenbacteria bacterium]